MSTTQSAADTFVYVDPEAMPDPANNGNECGLAVDGDSPCTGKAIHGGWCRKHGSRWRETGRLQLTRGKGLPKVNCLVVEDGVRCRNVWHKAGECKEHYTRKIGGETDTPPMTSPSPAEPPSTCDNEACQAVVVGTRWCPEHTCMWQTCDERRHARKFCDSHARNVRLFDHPDRTSPHAAAIPDSEIWLPIEPLLEAQDACQGVTTQMFRSGLTHKELQKYSARVRRAIDAGRINVDGADILANAIGIRPEEMWGEQWYTVHDTYLAHA